MIVVGFGGNVGDRAALLARFRTARARLARIFDDLESAALYQTAPMGRREQAAFLNTAVGGRYTGEPTALLAELQALEAEAGRERNADDRWGPRTLDLDVLLWDARVIASPDLRVPHPRLAERRFALAPLVELVGSDAAIPGIGRAGDALARVAGQDVARVALTW